MSITANTMSASGEKVKIINNILPKLINLDIIKILSDKSWQVGDDHANESKLTTIMSGKYRGFVLSTYDTETSHDQILNIFADIIYKKILEELNAKGHLFRVMWNMYYKDQNTNLHIDNPNDGFITIIYNLHTTDGGVQIDNKFYPDLMGQAKVFDSLILHQGFGPKKDNVRFSLNIVFKKY